MLDIKKLEAILLAAISVLAAFTLIYRLPSAKAAITPEFYDPLGNLTSYSFEGPQNSSIFAPPPGWTGTGQRFLETDVNSDGKCDIKDLARVSAAFGRRIDRPDWDPAYDFNKDGKIDIKDVAPTCGNFGKPNQALDGTRSWLIGGSGNYYLTRNVENSCLPFLESRPWPRVTFAFYFLLDRLYAVDGAVQARVTFTFANGSMEDWLGVWTVPMGNTWTVAYAVGRVRIDDLVAVEVRIKLRDIRCYIDYATFSVLYMWANKCGPYGGVGISANIFMYKYVPGTHDRILRFVPSIYVETNPEVPELKIEWFQLKITCYTPDSDYKLHIVDIAQANDQGYPVKPSEEETWSNARLQAAGILIPFVGSLALSFGVGAALTAAVGEAMSIIYRTSMTTTFGFLLNRYLAYCASDFDHQTASGVEDNAVWETWPFQPMAPELCVNMASGLAEVDWTFNSRSSTGAVGISVEANMCVAYPLRFDPPFGGPPIFFWVDEHICTASTDIPIGTV